MSIFKQGMCQSFGSLVQARKESFQTKNSIMPLLERDQATNWDENAQQRNLEALPPASD
jgi:hypothetical protein